MSKTNEDDPVPEKLSKQGVSLLLNYISDSVEVSSTAPLELDVVKTLGRTAEVGWIASDDGDVYVQINNIGAIKIPLGFKTTGYGSWIWSADATNITITVAVSGTYNLTWDAEYKP